MQFLKTLFWALLAATAALFAWVNWNPVSAGAKRVAEDVRVPLLLIVAILIGWLPTWLIMRARIWTFRRRYEALERQHAAPIAPTHAAGDETPTT